MGEEQSQLKEKHLQLRGELGEQWEGILTEGDETTVTFEPGDNGIILQAIDLPIVDKVEDGSQAQRAGVRPGWKFHQLEGEQFSPERFDQLKAGRDEYKVSFIKDICDAKDAK